MVGKILNNESAAEGLPLRIVTAIILFSAILGLSYKAIHGFISDTNEKKLLYEIDLIEKSAAVMYVNGGARDIDNPFDFSGTVENITVKIPDNAAYVVFGAMPGADNKPPETRDAHSDNVLFYALTDGKVQTRTSVARFSANDTNLSKPVVLYPGEYELTLELIKNNNGTYVKIE